MLGRAVTAGLLILITGAVAAEPIGAEATAFAGYRMGGQVDADESNGEIKLDDSGSFGFIVNWPARENTEWEVLVSSQPTSASIVDPSEGLNERVDLDSYTAQLGGTYLLEGERVVPYVAMTLGGTHFRTSGAASASDTFFSASIGLGLKLRASERLGARLEARAYGTLIDSDSEVFCVSSPTAAGCAIDISGDIAGQIELFAGVTLRF